jgi:hypothetical protein
MAPYTVSSEELATLNEKFPHPQKADEERIARTQKVDSDICNWKRRRKSPKD